MSIQYGVWDSEASVVNLELEVQLDCSLALALQPSGLCFRPLDHQFLTTRCSPTLGDPRKKSEAGIANADGVTEGDDGVECMMPHSTSITRGALWNSAGIPHDHDGTRNHSLHHPQSFLEQHESTPQVTLIISPLHLSITDQHSLRSIPPHRLCCTRHLSDTSDLFNGFEHRDLMWQ